MSDIRKYVELLESYERINEGKRQDAIATIESRAYIIGLHFVKLYYMDNHSAVNHWIVELRTFINDIISKTRKTNIKQNNIYECVTSIILSVQMRNKMISEIHKDYEYIPMDLNDIYRFLERMTQNLSNIIDVGVKIDYNDIREIYVKSI